MANPWVSQVDHFEDHDGLRLWVGVDHGLVTIGAFRLDPDQREQFERAYAAACQAADAYEEPE